MRTFLVPTAVLTAVVLAGCCALCRNSASAPVVAHRPPEGVGSAAAGPAGDYRITPENAKVTFVGSTSLISHAGSFERFAGTIQVPGNDLTAARIAVEIHMESVATKIFLLTKHLKAPDFFDVKRHPKSSFVSTRIEQTPTADATHRITGEFSLHGVTRTVTIPARMALENDQLALDCTFAIKQSDFGMTEAAKKTNDEVPITVSVRATLAEAAPAVPKTDSMTSPQRNDVPTTLGK